MPAKAPSEEHFRSGCESWVIEARDWKQDRWREVFNSIDKGEARYGLFNYVMRHPGRIVRVLPPDGWTDSE